MAMAMDIRGKIEQRKKNWRELRHKGGCCCFGFRWAVYAPWACNTAILALYNPIQVKCRLATWVGRWPLIALVILVWELEMKMVSAVCSLLILICLEFGGVFEDIPITHTAPWAWLWHKNTKKTFRLPTSDSADAECRRHLAGSEVGIFKAPEVGSFTKQKQRTANKAQFQSTCTCKSPSLVSLSLCLVSLRPRPRANYNCKKK
jgi:hypothetical protein